MSHNMALRLLINSVVTFFIFSYARNSTSQWHATSYYFPILFYIKIANFKLFGRYHLPNLEIWQIRTQCNVHNGLSLLITPVIVKIGCDVIFYIFSVSKQIACYQPVHSIRYASIVKQCHCFISVLI